MTKVVYINTYLMNCSLKKTLSKPKGSCSLFKDIFAGGLIRRIVFEKVDYQEATKVLNSHGIVKLMQIHHWGQNSGLGSHINNTSQMKWTVHKKKMRRGAKCKWNIDYSDYDKLKFLLCKDELANTDCCSVIL